MSQKLGPTKLHSDTHLENCATVHPGMAAVKTCISTVSKETLFEQRVRTLLSEVLIGVKVQKGAHAIPARYVFDEHQSQQAYPDLVIRSGSRPLAIGDVKYKEWTGSADESDIYQLLVHTSAFECDKSFLVFPHDRFEFKSLGRAATGAQTWLFAVDIQQLKQGLVKCAETMQLTV